MSGYKDAISLSELLKATLQCGKGLSYKASVSGYLIDMVCKNHKLQSELLNDVYSISKYLYFVIKEPKTRLICATRFRDRVWQKSMCNNGVRDNFLNPLIYDNGACQKNKGVDFAIDRLICHLQKYYRKYGTNDGYYDHLDIKGYFPNTPHSVSKHATDKYVKDSKFREQIYKVIDSFVDQRPTEVIANDPFGERGTALGSELSQLIELAIPNHIDHAIKERYKPDTFIRFNDDMIIVSNSKETLSSIRNYIFKEYAKLGLQVTIKQSNEKLSNGVKFLKRRIVLTDTGKVIVKSDPSKFSKERKRLRKLKEKLDEGTIDMESIADHYQSARAGLDRCDEKVKVRNLDLYYSHLFNCAPPPHSRRKKNAYCKSKAANRAARG